METEREAQLPGEVGPQVERIVGAIGVHDDRALSGRVVFPEPEVVMKEVALRVTRDLVEGGPGRALIGVVEQGVDPGRIKSFSIPAPGHFVFPDRACRLPGRGF